MPRDIHSKTGEPITRADYRREPYVRVTLDDGTTLDGKAKAWTATLVLFRWVTGHEHHSQWVNAENVHRITRSESAWQDVYDHHDHE